MAFPQTQLGVVAAIAPGADPVDPSGWVFTDITSDVRSAAGVQITVGRQDETAQVDATRVAAVVDNRSGDYCRTNPVGAWYGQLGRGTPLEIRVTRIADTFTRTTSPGLGTDAVSGLTWTHTSSSVWAATGSAATCTLAAANTAAYAFTEKATGADVEITGSVKISAVTTGANWVHAIVARAQATTDHYRLHVEFDTTGQVACKIGKIVDNAVFNLTSVVSTGITYTSATVVRYRARVVGSTLQIRAWQDGTDEPTTWTCEADDDDFPEAGVTGIYSWRVAGNTNVGSLVSTFDDWRVDVIRAITPVPEWPVRWDQSGNNATVPIVGAGILRRLAQGQPTLRSPIYRQLSGLGSLTQGYWPLEDQSGARYGANVVADGAPAAAGEVDFGSTEDCPPGALSAATLRTAGVSRITGLVRRWTTATNGYAVMAYVRMPTLSASAGSTADNVLFRLSTAGTVVQWIVYATSGGWNIEGYKNDGTLQVNVGSFSYTVNPAEWMAVQLECEESGSNVNWSLLWHQVGATDFYTANGSYAGTADRVSSATLQAPVDGTLVSHLWAGDDALPFVDTTFQEVSAGYAGETAGDRLVRLCEQEGVPLTVIGDTAATVRMGAEKPTTLLSLLRTCEVADQGVLYERGAGIGYLTREARYNGDPAMALDFTSGHVAAPPEPTDDDQRLRNRVTVRRTGGSEATAEDTTSIATDGLYADEVEVNLDDDDQLPDHASWLLHLGTQDGLRWPSISLDLARNPDLIDEWCKVRVGSRITIANPPDQVGLDALDLIVEGWEETLTDYGWRVTLACSPAEPWNVGTYDDPDARYDSRSTILKTGVTDSATSLTFRTSDPLDLWSTTEEPYDVVISGERLTVTAMGAASLVSGAYDQAATVTRSVNGIVKALPADAEIHVAPTPRYAL